MSSPGSETPIFFTQDSGQTSFEQSNQFCSHSLENAIRPLNGEGFGLQDIYW